MYSCNYVTWLCITWAFLGLGLTARTLGHRRSRPVRGLRDRTQSRGGWQRSFPVDWGRLQTCVICCALSAVMWLWTGLSIVPVSRYTSWSRLVLLSLSPQFIGWVTVPVFPFPWVTGTLLGVSCPNGMRVVEGYVTWPHSRAPCKLIADFMEYITGATWWRWRYVFFLGRDEGHMLLSAGRGQQQLVSGLLGWHSTLFPGGNTIPVWSLQDWREVTGREGLAGQHRGRLWEIW